MRLYQDIIITKPRYHWAIWLIILMMDGLTSNNVILSQGTLDEKAATLSIETSNASEVLVQEYYDRCYEHYRAERHDSVIVIVDQGIALASAEGLSFLEAQLIETKALSLEFLDIDQSIDVYLQAIEAYDRLDFQIGLTRQNLKELEMHILF